MPPSLPLSSTLGIAALAFLVCFARRGMLIPVAAAACGVLGVITAATTGVISIYTAIVFSLTIAICCVGLTHAEKQNRVRHIELSASDEHEKGALLSPEGKAEASPRNSDSG